MGAEFTVGTLEEMCDLMCDNAVPEKLCDTCIYRNNVEQLKPCIIYRDNCEYYEKERGDMTREEAILCLKGIKNYGRDTFTEQSDWQNSLDMAIEALEQEPKTGHWSRKTKVDAYDIAGVKTWGIKCQCDRCDFTTIVVEDFGYYKYCPNCGCRMVEPQESEEV